MISWIVISIGFLFGGLLIILADIFLNKMIVSMERILQVKGKVYSIDELCEKYCSDANTNFVDIA